MDIKNVVIKKMQFERKATGNYFWDFVIGFEVMGHRTGYNALLKLDKELNTDFIVFEGIEIADVSLETDTIVMNQYQEVADNGYTVIHDIINNNIQLQLSTLFEHLEVAQYQINKNQVMKQN